MNNDQEAIPRYPFQPTLKIGDFEGPLDLLLHLIRQSKMIFMIFKLNKLLNNILTISER